MKLRKAEPLSTAADGTHELSVSLPDGIRFGRAICNNLAQAERREWWLSNGLGAYAAGNLAGTLARRYHGLLIAPVHPPSGRVLVFAKADAELVDGERRWPLFTNRWGGGAVDPQGHIHIESFHLDGRMPVWRFVLNGLWLEYRVWMEPGAHVTYLAWRLLPDSLEPAGGLKLRVRLLVNDRDHHGNARPWEFNPLVEADGYEMRVHSGNHFTLFLRGCGGGGIESDHTWYENFDLPIERERGLPAHDAHLCVGQALLDLRPGEWIGIVASLNQPASPYLCEALRRFRAYEKGLLIQSRVRMAELVEAPEWIDQLVLAADTFLTRRPLPDFPEGWSVVAGFPWFGQWGRDAMIALPGLALATGRFEQACRILETCARFVDQGLLANTLEQDVEASAFNSADAALWFIECWRAYLELVPDKVALREIFPLLRDIIAWHERGTRHGIAVYASDGLLHAGEPGLQLTWMDAKVGDWVVTPRTGKPVEINALWYNALRAMAVLAERLGSASEGYEKRAEQVRQSFQRFRNPANGGLHDVLDGPDGDDGAVRPNQILAVSLPYSPLDAGAQAGVVRLCRRELLTSYGLRSLSPSHARFRHRYRGGVEERDGAYHQGTVWGWLLGHYALAEYRVHGDAAAAQALLEPIRDHLLDAGLGTVSEIFDGEPPHAPQGCPAQAWSVACVLEAWWRLERARRQARG